MGRPESVGWRGWINRPRWGAEAVWDLLHGGCRGVVHDVRRIDRRLAAAGLRRGPGGHAGLWHYAIHTR